MTASNYQKTSFKEYLKEKSFTSKSINRRMVVMEMFWKWLEKENLEAEEVSYNDLLSYMKYKRVNGASQRTLQNYMGMIKHFYEHLLREGKVSINPASDIEVKGVKRKMLYHILEPHELQALYNQYPDDTRSTAAPKEIRNKVMLGLLVNQGLTTPELSRMEVSDIDLRQGIIDVKGSRRSNGRKMKLESHQVMEMYDYTLRVRQLIKELPAKRKYQERQESERLFIGDGGNPPAGGLSNLMTQLMIKVRKMNPSVLNAQQIRASVITKWLRMYNLREVQYLAGHKYISSTEGYLENEMEGLKEEIQQYHPMG
ncbi:tyrosine-type recombinase/integrase [Ekhidna sp.]|uniref:tyrosine-type recombinase/integrase n=1 Tax=Ekhidna sp. TaxID=2608089 RepID=UPI0032ED3E1E